MPRAVLFLCLLLSGCSSIFFGDPPEGFLCKEDSADACPQGQLCDVARGCCRKPGSYCSGPDLAHLDLSATPADLAEPFGCAGRGVKIGPGLYGCEGPFGRSQASALCAPGFTISDSNLSAQEVSSCGTFNSFYLSKSLIYHSGLNVTSPVQCNSLFLDTLTCTPPNPLTFRFRLGCGGYRFNGYLECAKYCGALYQVVSCYPPTPIDCYNSLNAGTLEDTNNNPNIGVLCRRK
jgi:hypothetical protein